MNDSRLLAVACALAAAALAPPRALPAQNPAQEADHQALRVLKTAYEDGVNGDKLDLLAPHLDPEFSGVMVTGEQVVSLKEMQDYWARMKGLIGQGGKYTVKINPDVSLLLGDVALAKGTTEDRVVTDAGKEYVFSSAWTAVARKVGGQWKLLRVQGSMDPIGNPFVVAFRKATGVTAGIAAGVVGIVVGGLLGFVAGRRRRAG